MSFEGVNVNQGQGGLNRKTLSTDAVMALVVVASALPGDLVNNTINVFNSLPSAEAAGINPAFDANEAILLHYHIEEFFAKAPNGILKVVLTDSVKASTYFATDAAKATFREHTDVKRIGFVLNGAPVGLVLDDEITACQTFINDLFADKIYLNGIYLEGRNISKTALTKRTLNCGKVSVVIAQDPAIASLDPAYATYAAVGSVLGMRAARKPNENLGSVDIIVKPDDKKGSLTFPLTDTLTGRWLSANLSDGTPVSSLSQIDLKQLTNFGYIYAGSFQGFPGVYFNGEPTCIALTSDYSSGENNGVWDKAALGIRNALLPKVRGWFERNPETGFLKNTAITDLENIGKKPLQVMRVNKEISGYNLLIPQNQNPTDQTPLIVKASVTLGAIIHTFEVDLSLI
ncbi:DUF2586 family protein [Flavobacterium facile]|uniref:DUF2586 family protein n=1 Tax=Flavobacterium facile TaxID=2893174 RepID=UPI002E785289|nr:DUF2586 family protein [Flavobacterium sp. T-12]